MQDILIALAVGKKLIEETYNVEYEELTDETIDEITQQIEADYFGYGFNDSHIQ